MLGPDRAVSKFNSHGTQLLGSSPLTLVAGQLPRSESYMGES